MSTNRAVYCTDGEQMPNWCMNDVSITGEKSDMELFLNQYCEQDPSEPTRYRFLYEKIAPVTMVDYDEHGACGNTNLAHSDAWGCKWDMTEYALSMSSENWNDKDWVSLDGSYDTPWNPPYNIYNRIVEIIEERDWNIEFNEWFYKEPGMQIAGWLPE